MYIYTYICIYAMTQSDRAAEYTDYISAES